MSDRVLPVLLLILAAGAATTATAQTVTKPGVASSTVSPTVDFRSSDWLSDRAVVNNNAEEIANVSDLILDRGSGRIQYIVIKTGTTLGMGGRAVAIPFAAFRWEAGDKDRFVLASTPEQLKQFPEYTPENWKAMKDASDDDKGELRQKLNSESASATDPYAGSLDTAKQARITGIVSTAERLQTSTSGEQVEITVLTADGSTKRIALGPSWYVNGSAAAPMRGDKVVVETLSLPRDPDQLLVATEFRNADRELRLRGSDGTPAWALKTIESGGRSYSTPYSRFLVLSDLRGTRIDSRGQECGKVHEIIIDRRSGELAFLSIDPNENFLGVADTKRLVPWSIATVALDGVVHIDASKEMVLASPETPSDMSVLNTGTHAERVYKAFDVKAPRFEAPRPVKVVASDVSDAWSAGGSIISAIERDSSKTCEGKVTDISEISYSNGIPSARVVKIRTSGNSPTEEVMLIGPASYMDNQKLGCKVGDSITVDACRTTVDGRPCWIAKSLSWKNQRVVLLDDNNTPAWIKP